VLQDDPKSPARENCDGTSPPVRPTDRQSLRSHLSVILVADDEAMVRNLVTLLMQREGHFVLPMRMGTKGWNYRAILPAK